MITLSDLRVKYQLPISMIAKDLGISSALYSRKEKNIVPFTDAEVKILLDIFDMKFKEINWQPKRNSKLIGDKHIIAYTDTLFK